MTKLLVVDDESDLEILIRQKFRKEIRENEYHFEFASNGQEAIEKITSIPEIDIILSDINMPIMDGITLLNHTRKLSPLTQTIMVSAYGDMSNIREAMNRGAYDFILKPIDFADLSQTIQKTFQHVLQLKDSMRAIRENNILKMYVDESVIQFMQTKKFENAIQSNILINGTVIFADLCGFTKISENYPPDIVVPLLNEILDIMVAEIIGQKGKIDKFIGDAVFAVFTEDFHLDRALDAALSIKEKINSKKYILMNNEYIPSISIGINSGQMLCGNIGSCTLKRLDFTVIGDVVNTAARLQSIADENKILITEECYQLIKQSFECVEIGEVTMKNKKNTSKVYEVIN